jgi:hypothetical protein
LNYDIQLRHGTGQAKMRRIPVFLINRSTPSAALENSSFAHRELKGKSSGGVMRHRLTQKRQFYKVTRNIAGIRLQRRQLSGVTKVLTATLPHG